jgi:thiol-disulfide isomerase/thioredoxin
MLFAISAAPAAVFGQATAPSPRTPDAINADLEKSVGQVQDAVSADHALQSPESRKTAAITAIPAIKKTLSLFDEMVAAQPAAKDELTSAALSFRTLALILDDPETTASVTQSATATGVDGARAKGMLAIADYVKGSDDAARNKALDAFDLAVKAAPDDMGTLSLLSLTSVNGEPSAAISDHLLQILKTDAQGPAAQQLVSELEGKAKLAAMENKPLVIAGVALSNPNFTTADWKGKVILVDFWATWCSPCKEELPRVKKMYSDYHAKGLEVLGVSCDNSGDDLKKFLAADPDMPWPQLFDEKTAGWHPLATSYGITGIPTMFLIDRQGILRTVDARSQMEDLIPKLLAESADAK